jgi:hypothetical protein
MQHLVNGFDAVCRCHRHDGKGDRRPASCFIPLGTRAAANNFFVARFVIGTNCKSRSSVSRDQSFAAQSLSRCHMERLIAENFSPKVCK